MFGTRLRMRRKSCLFMSSVTGLPSCLIILLAQIDRCYAWKSSPDGPARISLDNQESGTTQEFEDRAARIRTGKSCLS